MQATTLWKEMLAQLPSLPGTANQESVMRPGMALAEKGYEAKHPVVIIPGADERRDVCKAERPVAYIPCVGAQDLPPLLLPATTCPCTVAAHV